jgi:hypothetical protein
MLKSALGVVLKELYKAKRLWALGRSWVWRPNRPARLAPPRGLVCKYRNEQAEDGLAHDSPRAA